MKILQVVFVTFLWASVLLISKVADLPSPVFVFFRVLFSMIVVLPLTLRGGIEKPRFSLVLGGIFIALNWIFLFLAVQRVGPSTADFVYYTAPIISLVLSALLGERVPLSSWIAAAVSFTGVGMIFSFSPTDPIGILYAFLGALFYGSVVVLGKFTRSSPSSITFYQMTVSMIFTLPFAMVMDYSLNLTKLAFLMIAGVFNTGLALVLWWDALKKLGIKTASVLSYLDPLFALALSVVFLNHRADIGEIIGGILIIAGGVIVILKSSRF